MKALDRLRLHLARPDALVPHAILGVTSGLLAGIVVVSFRLAVEWFQSAFLPGGDPENYEALSGPVRLLLPIAGASVVGIIFHRSATRSVEVGVIHVMIRLSYHQGYLPLRNAVMQLFGAALSIISGNSVGREGPGIHLGSTSGSLLAQALGLPNNSVRIMVACGAAASIAASFNTPIAGVIFAMEVVMMEYTIEGFTPVILAAVAATSLTRSVYGSDPAFDVPALELSSLWELPFIALTGVVVGIMGAALTKLVAAIDRRFRARPLWTRTALAGMVTGILALIVPEIMGIGYDTVSRTLHGELAIELMLFIVAFKFLATATSAGLALPGGIIGPTLVIGASAGGALGMIGGASISELNSDSGLYAMLGMGAMMGAVLQAPLSALMAIVELTANAKLFLPGMLAVIAATLTAKGLLRVDSHFLTMMRERGLEHCHDPIAMALSRISVAASMDRSFVTTPGKVAPSSLAALLAARPRWVLVEANQRTIALLSAESLEDYLTDRSPSEPVDLLEIPVPRRTPVRIPLQSTLQEALQTLYHAGRDTGFVAREDGRGCDRIFGVLTREEIEATYGRRG